MRKATLSVLTLILALTLCFGMTACSDETTDRLQTEFGAIVEGGNFEDGSVLNVNGLDITTEQANEMFDKLEKLGVSVSNKAKAYIYDIFVSKDGKEVQPNGKVKVTVPLALDEIATGFSVYHIDDSGKAERIPSSYADGKVTFETDSFSYYVFVMDAYENVTDWSQWGGGLNYTLTVTVEPAEGGYIEINDERKDASAGIGLAAGCSHRLMSVANDGYRFVGWYEVGSNEVLVEDDVYDLYMNKNYRLIAKFEDRSAVRFLAQTSSEGGYLEEDGERVEFNGARSVPSGTKITLTAVPVIGYVFAGWAYAGDANGIIFSGAYTYEFTVTEDTSVIALFEEFPTCALNITPNIEAGGYVTQSELYKFDYSKGMEVAKGTEIRLQAFAADGYRFVGWYDYETGDELSTNEQYIVHMIEDKSLEVKFELIPVINYRFMQTIQGSGYGSILENNEDVGEKYKYGSSLAEGTEITLTAVADEYSLFKGWYNDNDDTLISTNATYTFKLTSHIIVYALFEAKPMYSFLVQCDPYNGGYLEENLQIVDFGNGRFVEPGTKITLTAVANEGYEFKGWGTRDEEWGLTIFSTEETYEFTVNANTYVQAVFEAKVTALELDALNAGFAYDYGDDGAVLAEKTIVEIGSELKPNVEYVLVYGVTGDGNVSLIKDTDYTIDLGGLDFNVAGTYTVTYIYTKDTSITVSLTIQVVAPTEQ